jgi:hypothetical protein
MKITYTPKNSPSLRGKVEAYYKSVFMELYVAEEGVCIDGVNSSNPGQGEFQEMIDLLREDFRGKELSASVPVNPIAKHVLDKKGIVYPKGKSTLKE